MNKEKETQELAQDIAHICPDQAECYCGEIRCIECLSRGLINIGYHKITPNVDFVARASDFVTVREKAFKDGVKEILQILYDEAIEYGKSIDGIVHMANKYGVEVSK